MPATKILLVQLVKNKESCIEAILNSPHGCTKDVIDKLIGQTNAFRKILDIYAFLELQQEEEVDDNAI